MKRFAVTSNSNEFAQAFNAMLNRDTDKILFLHSKDERLTTSIKAASKVSSMLDDMGTPSTMRGYAYIRDSVVEAVHDPFILGEMNLELYPTIADLHKTTSTRVERDIRHAIEYTWSHGNEEAIRDIFGNSISDYKGIPSNVEFIAYLLDRYNEVL